MARQQPRSEGQRGFTLIEVLVALALLTLVMIAFLAILNTFTGVAKVQGNMSDATESLRYSVAALVRLTRMAGTGGLPVAVPDAGGNLQALAVDVEDNVDGSATYQYGGRIALAGTDVLLIRGVITGDLFDIQGATAVDTGSNRITVPAVSPYTGNDQGLAAPANPANRPVLISLQTPLDLNPSIGGTRKYSNFRVVNVGSSDGDVAMVGSPATSMTIDFVTSGSGASQSPGGAWAAFPPGAAYAVGFLDDMAFFIADNATGEPSLYRWFAVSNAAEELVPNVSSLQVALGCDINRDGVLADSEWFHSAAQSSGPTGDQMAALREVRLSVVARSREPDRSWTADGEMPENAAALTGDDLRYRYRTVTVRVALRSHPPLQDV